MCTKAIDVFCMRVVKHTLLLLFLQSMVSPPPSPGYIAKKTRCVAAVRKDFWICTYLKSGTTLTSELVKLAMGKSVEDNTLAVAPWVEVAEQVPVNNSASDANSCVLNVNAVAV